ncbi:MAG TPA: nitrilase-related carbon-nitrogen hydrolase [Thermoanaerobaculia bacterium]
MVKSKVALISFFPQLGALTENITALNGLVEEALRNGANIVVAPELATTGYSITADQARNGLGLAAPFPQLQRLRDLANAYKAYVFLGLAEVAPGSPTAKLYNSVVLFGPGGLVKVQRKRSIPLWHGRGELPFAAIPTPYGELAAIICADSYLMDWSRISTLSGADILVSSANWWGDYDQEEIWQTRAKENGVWMVVANRWGQEVDRRSDSPSTYEMNDAPSVVISPDGKLRLHYRADQEPRPTNKILYATLQVPASRIGASAPNPTYTVRYRRPSAYTALANRYYRPDQGNMPAPGLPPAGTTRVAVLAYKPVADPRENLAAVARLQGGAAPAPDALVLPGLGISASPVDLGDDGWYGKPPWKDFQEMVDGVPLQLAVTTILARGSGSAVRPLLLLARAGQAPLLREQIHEGWGAPGSGQPPITVDLPHARVGVVSGLDLLFPEVATQLAKSGVDLVVVSSTVAAPGLSQPGPGPASWTAEDLFRAWQTGTGQCFHLAASDASGYGLLVQDGGCYASKAHRVSAEQPYQILDLDSTTERKKILNTYHPFDLQSLLGGVD